MPFEFSLFLPLNYDLFFISHLCSTFISLPSLQGEFERFGLLITTLYFSKLLRLVWFRDSVWVWAHARANAPKPLCVLRGCNEGYPWVFPPINKKRHFKKSEQRCWTLTSAENKERQKNKKVTEEGAPKIPRWMLGAGGHAKSSNNTLLTKGPSPFPQNLSRPPTPKAGWFVLT